MYCPNCGVQAEDDAAFCTKCGASLKIAPQQTQQVQQQPQYAQVANTTTNTIAIVGFVLSFFVALAGFICSIIGYNNAKRGAPYRSLAIAGIVISAVSWFIYFSIIIAACSAALTV